MLGMAPPAKADDPVIVAAAAAVDLAEQTAGLGDPADLEAAVLANPGDHESRFQLALVKNAMGDRVAAAEHLLAIIRADREWNDQQARKQLLQFFDVWGQTDAATLTARRQLSSLLFS